ncbi:MAG: hypothetical protein IJR79_02580 [Clostridia bacterium]|nr:hypothetical protein [Clostridia bacterium]MBQ7751838.1 hypothetical protein [Clostridia bacterium]
MKYIPLKKQILKEQQKNAELSGKTQKNAADIDYIAMMCDVELGETEENSDAQ